MNLPATVTTSGRRQRSFFKTKKDAETFCTQQRINLVNYGTRASTLKPGELEQAAIAFDRLAPYGVSLNEVVAAYIERRDAQQRSVRFAQLATAFGKLRKRSGAYATALKYTFRRFAVFDDRNVADIRPEEIEQILEGMTPSVRNASLRILRAVFNFGVKREYLERNPISKLDFAHVAKGATETLTPEKARLLMAAALSDPALVPYHALGLFAGIRPAEMMRLNWKDIDMDEQHIEITGAVAKGEWRRIVPMEPNLHAWLAKFVEAGGEASGNVTPSLNLRMRLRRVRAAAGLEEWVQDVMRHSYASYWLAQHGDINRLTAQMGHSTTRMLWRHYHKASKRKDAAMYWQITPAMTAAGMVPAAPKAGV